MKSTPEFERNVARHKMASTTINETIERVLAQSFPEGGTMFFVLHAVDQITVLTNIPDINGLPTVLRKYADHLEGENKKGTWVDDTPSKNDLCGNA